MIRAKRFPRERKSSKSVVSMQDVSCGTHFGDGDCGFGRGRRNVSRGTSDELGLSRCSTWNTTPGYRLPFRSRIGAGVRRNQFAARPDPGDCNAAMDCSTWNRCLGTVARSLGGAFHVEHRSNRADSAVLNWQDIRRGQKAYFSQAGGAVPRAFFVPTRRNRRREWGTWIGSRHSQLRILSISGRSRAPTQRITCFAAI